jgi:FdhE protein
VTRSNDPLARARADLDRLAAERPVLAAPLRWLRELLPELAPDPDAASDPPLDPEQARAKLGAGVPLLRGQHIEVDRTRFLRRWERACAALEAQQPDGHAAALASAVRDGRLDPGVLVESVLAGQPDAVRGRAAGLGLDPALATTVLRFALFPAFTALEARLTALRGGVVWRQGYCPTCGGWPLLGEFRGLEQTRFLRCGLCAAGWEVPRLWCPYCGNTDHERLGWLHPEGEEGKARVLLCEGCRGYVKMVPALFALAPLGLLVADAATLHLDLAASERGYAGPP